MLDPWIIEQIKRQEEEKRRRQEEERREQPTIPADDPREMPERRDDRRPDPGYEMPSPGDRKREEQPSKKEDSDRGVTTIDIGGGSREEDEDPNTIDIAKVPVMPSDEKDGEERPE